QERCPSIFSKIDVGRCTKDASRPAVVSVLQRYAGALPAEAVEGLWILAAEDAAAAMRLCAEKIFALPDTENVLNQARDLVATVLDAIRLENSELARILESFLQRTQSWRGHEKSQAPVHHLVVDHLLSTPRLHGLLDLMISGNAVAWGEILQPRANTSRVAAELLWKYHHHHGQVRPEWAQLQRLVESPQFYSLKDRIRYLRLSQERKTGTAAEDCAVRLSCAEQLQFPLFNELQELAVDTNREDRRMAAKKRCRELHQLQGVRELYEIAEEFGFGHLQLAIAGFSGVKMAHHVATTLWVSLLFPPGECLYFEQASASPKDLFPLLMLRPHREFFLSKQANVAAPPWTVEPTLLRNRMVAFLHELREVASDNHHLWATRCVGTLLEFSNCLWLQNQKEAPHFGREEGDASAGPPLIDHTCLWVAMEVLSQEPFNLSLPDLVTFYAEMISQLHVWHKDLEERLPAYLRAKQWVWPSEEDVHLHLSQVALVVLASWLREAERLCGSSGPEREKAERHFAQVWRRSADSLLVGLYLRLNGSKLVPAQRLLVEVIRLEKSCRLLLERVAYLPDSPLRPGVADQS
ncbi:Protein transport protein Sec61 subunit beta, partial [Durusdinium trenchii]